MEDKTTEIGLYLCTFSLLAILCLTLYGAYGKNNIAPCGGCGNPYLDINHLPFKEEQCLNAGGAIIIATYDKRTENCIISGAANITKIS